MKPSKTHCRIGWSCNHICSAEVPSLAQSVCGYSLASLRFRSSPSPALWLELFTSAIGLALYFNRQTNSPHEWPFGRLPFDFVKCLGPWGPHGCSQFKRCMALRTLNPP